MALLRSNVLCPVFGSATELPGNILPSYEDIMKYYLWTIHFDCPNKDLVRNTSETVALKVEETWRNASIPIIEHRVVVKRIQEYHKKYRNLLKPYKARKNVESYKKKIKKFVDESKRLFDIATCKCANQNVCVCERTRKIPTSERNFLNDQRSDKKMIIGGVDVATSQKQSLLIERKQKREAHYIG